MKWLTAHRQQPTFATKSTHSGLPFVFQSYKKAPDDAGAF